MKNTLANLFDFQKFAQNSRLSELISQTEAKYSIKELSDDELELINAAGDINAQNSLLRKNGGGKND